MPLKYVDRSLAFQHADSVFSFDNFLCVIAKKYLLLHRLSSPKVFFGEDSSADNLKQLSQGGQGTKTDYLPSYLIESYSHIKDCFVIFDDVMAGENDYILSNHAVHSLSINNELYRFARLNDLDIDTIRKMIFCVSVSWHFVCFVVRPKEYFREDVLVDNLLVGDLKDFLVMEIIVGAFDEEGYLHFDAN